MKTKKQYVGWIVAVGDNPKNCKAIFAANKSDLKDMAWHIGWLHVDLERAQKVAITSPQSKSK